jgi:fermentation-respiration switch protein FrsA (DUF1100 family)
MKIAFSHCCNALSGILLLFLIGGAVASVSGQDLSAIENAILFFPDKKIEATPNKINLKFDAVELITVDKVKLCAWWTPSDNARATLIFSHGNGGNISHRLDKLKIFHDLALNVLLYDYRGYGKSEGSPNEKGFYADVEAAYDFVVNDKKIPADQIIAYGESLGGPVAAHLAANNKVQLLILESTFTNLEDMARLHMPLLAGLAKSKFDTLADVAKMKSPVLVLHSPNDEIVPYAQGQKLFASINTPKQFVILQGDHNNGFWKSKNTYMKGLDDFITAHVVSVKPSKQ